MLDVVDGVTSQTVDIMIIPNIHVQFHKAFRAGFTIREKILVLILLQVTLIDIYCQDDCANSDHRGAVFQKLNIVALKLTNLKQHIINNLIKVVVEYAEEALHGLDGAGEVEVETEHDKDVGFEVNQLLFAYKFLLIFSEKINHSGKTGRDWLF